jgi:hypothetical protein
MTALDSRALPERFEDLEPAERLRVLKAGSAMTHFVFSRTAAVLLAGRLGQTGYVRSGSGFVLQLPDREYLGTAWHVVKEWHDVTKTGSHVVFQVGGVALDPNDRLAWKDEEQDIVFLRLLPGEAARIGIQPCEPLIGCTSARWLVSRRNDSAAWVRQLCATSCRADR